MKKNIVRFPAFGILIVTLLATLNAQVARVRAQNIFVGDASGAYMVVKFDASGNETTFAPINWGGSSWDQPAGLALDNGGNLYVAYFGGGTNFVKKFDANGNATIFTFLNSTFAPEGILFDSHTNLYVANTYNGTIEKFSASGADLGTFGNVTMQWPDALAFDSKGNLYVSDLFGEKIYKFNASGQGTVFVSGDYYRGLAFDRSDNLYVGVGWSIDKFDTNGASLGNLGMRAGEFAAEGMMFDNFGNLFMSDYLHGTICKFDPLGNETTFGSITGTSELVFLAVQTELQLAIAPVAGNKVVLNWPMATTNYILQTSTNLASVNWTDSTGSPFTSGGRCWVTNTANGKAMFYRLRKP